VTTVGSHSHAGIVKCLVNALLMCSCGSSSQMDCKPQGDFQLISRLRLWLEVMKLFQHGKTSNKATILITVNGSYSQTW